MTNEEIENIDFRKGLIPAIIQDNKTLKVLMLGYMNKESLEKTVEENKVTFFSRSKNRLWTKGEESENYLIPSSIELDCDSDTFLILAEPKGPICHQGTDTCWGHENQRKQKRYPFLKKLENTIDSRLRGDFEGEKSYINELAERGTHKIAQKVGEEAVELVIESGKEDDLAFLEESSDLFFHYLVLLHDRGFKLSDVLLILKDRHKG